MPHSATLATRLGAELKARILPQRGDAALAPHKSSCFCSEQGGENRWSPLSPSPRGARELINLTLPSPILFILFVQLPRLGDDNFYHISHVKFLGFLNFSDASKNPLLLFSPISMKTSHAFISFDQVYPLRGISHARSPFSWKMCWIKQGRFSNSSFFDVTIAVAIRGRSGESRFLSFTIYRERIGEEEEESIRSFEF